MNHIDILFKIQKRYEEREDASRNRFLLTRPFSESPQEYNNLLNTSHCQLNRAQDTDAVTKRETEERERERPEKKLSGPRNSDLIISVVKNVFFSYVYMLFFIFLPPYLLFIHDKKFCLLLEKYFMVPFFIHLSSSSLFFFFSFIFFYHQN